MLHYFVNQILYYDIYSIPVSYDSYLQYNNIPIKQCRYTYLITVNQLLLAIHNFVKIFVNNRILKGLQLLIVVIKMEIIS